jgi:hypothetical protein
VGAVDVSHTTHTDAGTYATDTWSFTGTANYNDIAATTITDSIAKATATVVVTPYTNVPYDGHAHTATVTSITGVNGETGATVGAVDVSHTMHTPAGTYATDYWFFTGTANYNDIGNTAITDSIAKANATVVVTPYTNVPYDGQSHTATVTSITGVNGETGATVGAVDVSHTTHTPAGTYASDYWFFTGSANYNDIDNTTITDSIAKANATVVVTPYNLTYDGNPHTATVTSITGVNGETGATVGTVDVSNTTHTAASTYATDSWSFTGTANYNNTGNTTITDTIAKAPVTASAGSYSGTYDGSGHSPSACAVTGLYTGDLSCANNPATVGPNVSSGTITPVVSGTGLTNFAVAPVNGSFTISRANATIVVTPYGVVYNGVPHTATGTAKGVLNESLSGLNLSGTTHTNPGDFPTDPWSFIDVTGNYNNANGTVHDSITYGACSVGAGGVILPPVNSDGTSVYSRKGGSTIPVKFNVCGANGAPLTDPTLVFAGTGGALTMTGAIRGTITVVNETITNDIPDAAFTWDGQQWHFNMATMNLSSGYTYTFRINLAYGNITFVVGVK